MIRSLLVILLLAGLATPVVAQQEDEAGSAVLRAGCRACHQIAGKGGSLAQPLKRIYKRFDAASFRAQLTAPPAGMPSYNHLPASELELIFTFFLGTNGSNGSPSPSEPDSRNEHDPARNRD